MNHDSVVVEETSATDRSVERPGRRRLLRLATVAGVVLSVYALTGFLLVPRLARWAIEEKGRAALHREVTLGEVRFNPFTLDLNLSGLRIRDRDRQPLFSLDRLHLALTLSGVFKRAWRLRELRIDRPYVELRVLRDGKLSIADLLTADNDSATLPRLIIDQFAIRDGKIDFVDQSVTPPVAVRLAPMNALVRDLVTLPEQRGEHSVSISFAGENTKSSIRMIGQQTISPFGLSGRIEARNIALSSLAERLSSGAPILLRRGQADVRIDYALRRRKAGGLQIETTRGELTATGLALSPRGQSTEQLVIPRLEVRDAAIAFPARRVEIGSVRIIERAARWAGILRDDSTGARALRLRSSNLPLCRHRSPRHGA